MALLFDRGCIRGALRCNAVRHVNVVRRDGCEGTRMLCLATLEEYECYRPFVVIEGKRYELPLIHSPCAQPPRISHEPRTLSAVIYGDCHCHNSIRSCSSDTRIQVDDNTHAALADPAVIEYLFDKCELEFGDGVNPIPSQPAEFERAEKYIS